jgi:hypothetical protein
VHGAETTRPEKWGPAARLAAAVGVFVSAVSVALFLYAVSPIASSVLSAAFIAGGVVGRRRATSAISHAMAVALLLGGGAAALTSVGLAAAGR